MLACLDALACFTLAWCSWLAPTAPHAHLVTRVTSRMACRHAIQTHCGLSLLLCLRHSLHAPHASCLIRGFLLSFWFVFASVSDYFARDVPCRFWLHRGFTTSELPTSFGACFRIPYSVISVAQAVTVRIMTFMVHDSQEISTGRPVDSSCC